MATSRTGTSQWKRAVTIALHLAQARGQTTCPHCGTILNYKNRRTPNGAWPDHITPWSKGGTHDQNNLIVICRTCNISKGNRPAPKTQTILKTKPLWTSRRW